MAPAGELASGCARPSQCQLDTIVVCQDIKPLLARVLQHVFSKLRLSIVDFRCQNWKTVQALMLCHRVHRPCLCTYTWRSIHIDLSIYMYTYVCRCVLVCLCVCACAPRRPSRAPPPRCSAQARYLCPHPAWQACMPRLAKHLLRQLYCMGCM